MSDTGTEARREGHNAVLDRVANGHKSENGARDGVAVADRRPRPNGTHRIRPLSNGHTPNGSNGAATAVTNGAGTAARRTFTVPESLPAFRNAVFRRLLMIADVAAAAGGLAVIAASTRHGVPLASVLSVPLIVVAAKLGGRYDHDELVLRKSTLDETPQLLVLAAAFALTWSAVAFFAGVRANLGGAGVVALWGATATLLVVLRASARALAQIAAPPERVLIIGASAARATLSHSLECDPSAHVEVVGFLPLEDERRRTEHRRPQDERRRRQVGFGDLESVVSELDVSRVFLMAPGSESELMLEAVRRTTQTGVKVSIVPRLFEVVGSSVEFDTVGGVTVLGVRQPGLGRSSRAIKRTVDLFMATLGLLILAPFGLLVAALIKLDTRGPVFFRQPRVGKDGKTFQMLKFRTMIDGAHAQREALAHLNETNGLFKIAQDPRVTRVGRLLRRSSLDELPQLINVLTGEMSLVGPRPLVPDEDALIEGRHRDRQNLTPGMTGLWQVLGPPRPPLSEMVKADYLYATNWTLWEDTKILVRTLTHVINRRGR